jgi:hypothetical protein
MNHHASFENSNNEIEGRRCARCEAELVLVRITPARLGFNFAGIRMRPVRSC